VQVLLDGGELNVEIDDDLRVNLTGWARPVFEGQISEDFLKELHDTTE
jgi:diaminopimelate epimerase